MKRIFGSVGQHGYKKEHDTEEQNKLRLAMFSRFILD